MKIFEMITDATMRSMIPYGTPEFPFAFYLDEITEYKSHSITWHWHRAFEFIYPLSSSVLCHIDGKEIKINTEEGLFINSGSLHKFTSDDNGSMISILFAPEFLASKGSLIYDQYLAPLLSASLSHKKLQSAYPAQKVILSQLSSLCDTANTDTGALRQLHLFSQTADLWKSFFAEIQQALQSKSVSTALLQARMHRMIHFIQSRYKEHLTLEDIASAANISKSEALRCFRSSIQTTPLNYLTEYRLTCAKQQLLDTEDSISLVASDNGFNSAGYFCRIFKKYVHTSPAKWREQ